MTVPDQPGALAQAVGWVSGLLTGSLGTALAVLCIAGVGLMLIQGRLPMSRAAAVIVGCFVLFGAHAIAAGLITFAGGARATEAPPAAPALAKAPPPPPYDPYAGASVQR